MKIQEKQVREQAEQAVEFVTSGGRKRGGYKPKRRANPYGVALKYIFALRDLTLEDAGKMNNSTPQSINYILNRMRRDRFDTIRIDKLCNNFNIERGYFEDLVREIAKIMEGR